MLLGLLYPFLIFSDCHLVLWLHVGAKLRPYNLPSLGNPPHPADLHFNHSSGISKCSTYKTQPLTFPNIPDSFFKKKYKALCGGLIFNR